MRYKISRAIGIAGTVACIVIFALAPSFPTPDKLLVFATFVTMIFHQAYEFLKRFFPFVALLFIYEAFRSVVPYLNSHVHYSFMINADKFMFFGHLPTNLLQSLLWQSHVSWYDFVFYLAYMLHFVLPLLLGVLIWKFYDHQYWRFMTAFVVVSFLGFLTYLVFPAAPPWMASQAGMIHVVRISSDVWYAFGIHNFPSLYSQLSPNSVAAMPSLHAAYALLFALFATKLFKSRWRWLAWLQPLLIWVGTVYQGEHYAIDELAGIVYGLAAYFLAPYVLAWAKKLLAKISHKFRPKTLPQPE